MIKQLAEKYKNYIIEIRRKLHMNPGLSWEEYEASNILKEELKKLNIPFKECAKTGIILDIKGTYPGKTILLRADMDALPIEELSDIPYKSQIKGKMHACGHDGHMAQLLGAIKILNENKELIHGTVRCIFQPAEEVGQGANKMIEEGVLQGVDSAFGIHLWSDIPVGKISVEEGPRLASADNFKIKILGKGGHGSLPNQCIDPIIVSSSYILNLQTLVSRETHPNQPLVITVGKIQGGTTPNIIPQDITLEGTVRCFDMDLRNEIPKKMERILKGITLAHRAEYEFEYFFYPAPVINDKTCARIAQNTVEKVFGKDALYYHDKMTGAEDFSAYSTRVPSVLALVGVRNEKKHCDYPHHHPNFNIDEEGLLFGTILYAQYAIDYLNNNK